MTIYFYDDKKYALIALDTETLNARVLQQVVLGIETLPTTASLAPVVVQAAPKAPKAKPSLKPGKKTVKCSKCGEAGHNAKTCGKVAKSEKSHPWRSGEGQGRELMSQMTFGRVKISQSHNVPSESIAANLNIDVREVERAMKVDTYSSYLEL